MADTEVDQAGKTDGTPSGAEDTPAPTTTISTISLQSGNTRLVIALLQSREWLQLKVLDVQPDLTLLGETLQDALEYQRAHDEVLLQLQSKQSPVEELLRQADQLISTQKPRAEVYAAMAESLGLAWKDVNVHLEQRKNILDLNVAYQSRAVDCTDKMRALEMACQDTSLPVEIEAVKKLLSRLHDLKRLMLESFMFTLQDGKALLERLKEIANLGTLDSRPGRIRTSASYAVSQVEHWLENLHDRRRLLEITWQSRKTQLEQCLTLALLAKDLRDVEESLSLRKESLLRSCDHLGDSSASTELLLHEHRKLFPEAKEFQDQCLKITKATEQLVTTEHFAGDEAIAQAYTVLNACVEYLEALEQREALLTRAIAFFRSSHTAITKLDQLEIQLTTTDLSISNPQLAHFHSQAMKTLEDITTAPLQEGYSLMETVGKGVPGAEGVRHAVEEIEKRKINLEGMCTAHKEENLRLSHAMTTFLERQNELFSWLVSIAEAFLQGHQDMGSVLAMAKDFLQLHHQLLSDLQTKGAEINDVLLSLPPILEHLNDEQRTDIDEKVDALHSHWLNLKNILENRIDLATLYVKFHTLAVNLATEFDAIEEDLRTNPDGINEDIMREVEQKWLHIQQSYAQLCNFGKSFIDESSKVGDPYLDIKRASLCVETLLEHFGSRQLVITDSWQTWQTSITIEREFKVSWERNMTESGKTLDWVSKLDAQLYPVLTGDSTSSKTVCREVEEKLQIVLPELKKAQAEIELRVKTAENLALKGDSHGQKEIIIDKLMELHNKLTLTITEYQILLQMLISFFKNLSEVEKTIENLQSQYHVTRLPNAVADIELLLKEHEASRQAVIELFKFTQNESEQIISRINQQEPAIPAKHDIERVTRLLQIKQLAWESAWTDRKLQLEQHFQLCQFDSDLQQINSTLSDLSKQLSALQGQYGESLTSAKATSLAFVYFEKTIELLELRIQTFVTTAEQMLKSEHGSSPHIERELNLLQTRWSSFHAQVVESRRLIDLSIKYFTLVEEAEEWFREGSKLLVTIARKSTTVRLPEEATQLLNEVEIFLKPGEAKQDERIKEISTLAVELYGGEKPRQVTLVLNENKEMLESFTVISEELNTLAKNLKAAEEQRERQKKEQEEVDASLAAAKAEAAAARAAAAAAEEARRAAEAAAKALQEAAPIREKVEIEVLTAVPVPPETREDLERERKSPSPPPKKVKLEEELPKPIAPIFTVPLTDAVIQEGERFTFECRVTGFPVPEVIWYKDGISIQNNPDYQTTYDQGLCTLTIEETFTEDSARFTCKAGNSAGTAETNATLSVKETEPEEQLLPPIFTKRLEASTAKEGSPFQLQCTVEGNPLPTVQWFKNDICIDNSSDYVITYNNGEAILKFEEVFLEDQVEYTCKATNQLGSDVCSAKLTVEPLEPTEAPSFIIPLSNVMARAGQKIKLECEVTGLPAPELSWSHNGKPVKETRDLKLNYEHKKASLVISEAFPKDAGTYVVAAKNLAGEATCTCNVSVKGRLPTETSDSELASDMEPIKPAIQLPLKDISVFEGKKVRLDCVIIGQPEPEVIWYHDERPVKESSDFELLFQGDRCSLIIHEAYLEDAGEYKVVAINSAGEASSKCNLTVKSIGDTEPATRVQSLTVAEMPSGTAPKFNKLLTDVLASEGDKVVLECSVNGDPKPDIKWFLNNKEVVDVKLKQFSEDAEGNISLTLLEVLPQDKGVYTVKASNSLGEAKCFANLIVKPKTSSDSHSRGIQMEEKQTPPSFKELFSDKIVAEKETTKFECMVIGRPTPKVKWYFNDEPVSGKDFLVSTSGDRQVLIIPQVMKHNAGKISCVAENDAGKATCVAKLNVKETFDETDREPSIISTAISEKTESSSFMVKKSVFMQSSSSQVTSSKTVADGTEPKIEIHSFSSQSEHALKKVGEKPAFEVQSQKIQEIHQTNDDKPEIRQQSFLKISNGGEDTQESSASSYSTPISSPKPLRRSLPPRFVTPLNGKIVDQGVDVVLEGIIDGFPQPDVTWTKNGQNLSPKEGSVSISWELNRARVELKNVCPKDAGRYTCTATNSVGSASSTADLVVKKTIFPPVFGRRLQAQMAKLGARVVMEVEVTGTPDPVVSWFKDGNQITGATSDGQYRTKTQGNCHLLIIEKASLEHSGKYAVKAVNAGGEAHSIADFVVFEPQPEVEIIKHTVYEDITESKTKTHSQPLQSTTVKATPEVASKPPEPSAVQPPTETGTSPFSHKPTSTLPRAPFTSESMIITETTTTEKQMSIKVERTPSPAMKKQPVDTISSILPHEHKTKLEQDKEVKIPVQIEAEKLPDKVISDSVIREDGKVSERVTEISLEHEEVPENVPNGDSDVGVQSSSISKKTAYDFFVSKMKESESDGSRPVDDVKKTYQQKQFEESIQMSSEQSGLVKQLISTHFNAAEIPDTKPILPTQTKDKTDSILVSSKGTLPQLAKSEHIKSEIHMDIPPTNTRSFSSETESVKTISESPFELLSSKFHSEHSSSTRFEKQIIHQSCDTLLDEFNLQPEPPPEMGFIPKSEVPGKYREDVTTRVKKLEEAHRVLSPIEIPSGGVRIFPAPVRSESQVEEKPKPVTPIIPIRSESQVEEKPKPVSPITPIRSETQVEEKPKSVTPVVSNSVEKVEIKEPPITREVSEEVCVQKKLNIPGTGDWSFQPVKFQPKEPITPQVKLDTSSKTIDSTQFSSQVLKTSQVSLATEEKGKPSEQFDSKPQFPKYPPKPASETIPMEKPWAAPDIKVPNSELTVHTTSSQKTIESFRSTSPRPSAEGLAMEKLWTPQKPPEPETIIPRPSPVGTRHFERDMSPKPSVEGLAMDRLWAHKHPDSGLRNAWPPSQPVEEKPIIPWAVKGSIEKSWPPAETSTSVIQETSSTLQKISLHEASKADMQTVDIHTKHRERTEDLKKEVAKETDLKSKTVEFPRKFDIPQATEDIKHYVAESRVVHSSSLMESEITSTQISQTSVTTEHSELKSEQMSLSQSVNEEKREISPPVVEEKIMKPSEAKKIWPPGLRENEYKSPPLKKEVLPKRDQIFKPIVPQEIPYEPVLEPGPPPEIGFAHPPLERRQSYVEAIEQDLEKDLEKEPSRHLVGAVRTIPPPPQKEKSLPPPLPPKEKAAPPPPPIPPKDKQLEIKTEIKSSSVIKEEMKTTDVTVKPKKLDTIAKPKKEVPSKPFEPFPNLEPFPFTPETQKPKPTKCPPPPKPTKFVKGEFTASDYESDFESSTFPRKWRPYGSDTDDIGYRKVMPPTFIHPKRPKSTEPEPLPPSQFEKPLMLDGPPRPSLDKFEISKKVASTEVTKKVTSKTELKSEKIKKQNVEVRRKHSPPALKPGSPPIFVQSPATGPTKPQEVKKAEPVSSTAKIKPDSPKSKIKALRGDFPESGYMADTDEPRLLKEGIQKSSSIRHEESLRTTVEQTTVVTEKFSHQSLQQQNQVQQKIIPAEKPSPVKPLSSVKSHHRHSEHKAEKKTTMTSAGTTTKHKKEVVAISRQIPSSTQAPNDERESSLEPFPFQPDPARPVSKRIVGPPPPSPSKFIKGDFRESDYESDYEVRIPPRWRPPVDSDAEEPSYRPVRPVLTPSGHNIQSRSSGDVRTPTPPTEFDNPPTFGGPPRPKFEPIEKPLATVKLEEILKPVDKPQKVFKPKPVTPRTVPAMDVIVATPAIKEIDTIILQPGSPPEIAFAPPPKATEIHSKISVKPYQNATQIETSKVMNFSESTEHSHRTVNVQQTTRVIKFGEKDRKEPGNDTKLEPFPFKPEPERPKKKSGPPPTTPKKFVPGEFRESDYESDYESMRIKPKWTPGNSDTDEPQYRKVRAPQITRSSSVPAKPSVQVPTPMEFDTQSSTLASSVSTTMTATTATTATTVETMSIEAEQKRLNRVEEMRKRFGETTKSSPAQTRRSSLPLQKQISDSSQEIVLQPGEPPVFGFAGGRIPTTASYVASKHMSEMTNTFKSKAQKFAADIMTDVRTPMKQIESEKSVAPKAGESGKKEDDPQAYREESRVSEFGTKHIDPGTGLIYFKYDFGYEFGIVLPDDEKKKGEKKTSKHAQIEPKRQGDIEVPVIHEKTASESESTLERPKKILGPQSGTEVGKIPQFRPKKFTHFKSVKWEPASESEMSEAEGDSALHKKRYSLPQPTPAMLQKEPHIQIPSSSRWDQASPSPLSLSLSPSLPSLSPHYSSIGPQSNTPVQESTVSPGGSWQGLSPNKSPRVGHGRGATPTPPSTPSTPGSTPGPVPQQLRKPPTFITPLRDIAVVSGQTARFECIVQAEPPPNILWSKNGRIIENSQDYQIQYRNGVCRLTIPQAYPEDAGIYTCTATNMLGTIGTSGSLQVPGERRSLCK
ncbi:titin isoform X1 [Anabrus simplex]|uniref:titin isoform X1 n=1 Tax=Anabrus simplex TaxID=316456 RepID=UPI0035A27653